LSGRALRLPRLVVAGTASGVGKTTTMLALTAALGARGLRVATFKCGPDYLDPTYHTRAGAGPCHNLDGWMMGRAAVEQSFARGARGADLALIEGVMGLYDGASPSSEEGSSAEIAKWLGAPVLLVVDAGGMARSIAALVHGFRDFDRETWLGAVACNRIGSAGHLELLRRALPDVPIVGGLPRRPELAFQERHLGLHRADERALPPATLDGWRALAAHWFDLDAIIALAQRAPELRLAAEEARAAPALCRIGVARDAAFHFYYEDNLRRLEALGAELVYFSPLAERALPDVDALYFGGGYPELFAPALAANEPLRAALRDFAARGGPIYGECGGLMYLAQAIETLDGARHPMAALLPGVARVHPRLQALGYVEVTTRAPSILGAAGLVLRGHQFRYSELVEVPAEAERVYELCRRRDAERTLEGYVAGSVLGSYVHAHWASNPGVAGGLCAAATAFARGRRRGVANAPEAWKTDEPCPS
jgi:cobyrinic acid a,c-diamide synthase